MIELRNITKVFKKSGDEIAAVNDLSLIIENGTFSVVYGKSGSGKSTLLMMIGGMMTPDKGEIAIDGHNLYALSRRERNKFRKESVGFMFQRFHLLPYFTVHENIALPLAMNKVADIGDKVSDIAEMLGISDRMKHYPSELSIGQQQRVAMAKALVNNPDIILADEPTGNLDSENGNIVVDQLRAVAESGKIVIAVTHDLSLLDCADNRINIVDGYLGLDKEKGLKQ